MCKILKTLHIGNLGEGKIPKKEKIYLQSINVNKIIKDFYIKTSIMFILQRVE